MTREKAIKIYRNKRSTKSDLQYALAFMLGIEHEAPRKAVSTSLHSQCKQIFCEAYKRKNNLDYAYAGRDAGALSQLLRKIEGLSDAPTEEFVLNTFSALIQKLPEWYVQNNFSLTVINSKFNEIIGSIKQNGKQQSTGVSESYKERVLREMQA